MTLSFVERWQRRSRACGFTVAELLQRRRSTNFTQEVCDLSQLPLRRRLRQWPRPSGSSRRCLARNRTGSLAGRRRYKRVRNPMRKPPAQLLRARPARAQITQPRRDSAPSMRSERGATPKFCAGTHAKVFTRHTLCARPETPCSHLLPPFSRPALDARLRRVGRLPGDGRPRRADRRV